jgi:lipopolysaccharide export system protein LptA
MTQDRNQPWRIVARVMAVAVTLAVATTQVIAQSSKSNGLFKQNPQKRDQPVKISSVSLEVRDKDKVATFAGDVHVVQGETELRCNTLVIFYDNDQGKAAPAPAGGERSNQKIRRMEARGQVVMTQKDQRAVSDQADFDVIKNTMVMIGSVVVTRGDDVMRGQRLFVDMTTGVSRMESGGGRVEGMFKSNPGQSPVARPGRNN